MKPAFSSWLALPTWGVVLLTVACSAESDRGITLDQGPASADPRDAGEVAEAGPARPPRPRPSDRDGGLTVEDASASDGSDAGGEPTTSDGGGLPEREVPDTAHCDPVALSGYSDFENEVLTLVNEVRATGYDCDSEGEFGPAPPLVMQPQLRCAARLHAVYMAETNDFAHTTLDGVNVGDRIVDTGYQPWLWGENIASGQSRPRNAVSDWLISDGHCRNLMDPEFEEIGIGVARGVLDGDEVLYWVQDFATP